MFVRILSGDLAPARRSRRRSLLARSRPALLGIAAVVLVGGGAYALRADDEEAGQRLAQGRPSACASTAPATASATGAPAAASGPAAGVVLPAPRSVSFRLLNGTPRDRLGKRVGDQLAARGFRVRSTGNAPKPLAGASRVLHGPGARPAAQLVAVHVLGASVSAAPAAPRGAVDVVLGTSFTRLRTPAEAAALVKRLRTGGASPGGAPAASPRPTPSGCA